MTRVFNFGASQIISFKDFLPEKPFESYEDISSQIKSGQYGFYTTISKGGASTPFIIDVFEPKTRSLTEFWNSFKTFKLQFSDQWLAFFSDPIYIAPETGVMFLEDGRVIEETIYTSTGNQTFERVVGGNILESRLAEHMSKAIISPNYILSPLFCRWSTVYFHAVSESLVHGAAVDKLNLSDHLKFPVPLDINNVQKLIVSQHTNVIQISSKLIKSNKSLTSSLLYNHSIMGPDFISFVTKVKKSIHCDNKRDGSFPQKIYISRNGSLARTMKNEYELEKALTELGFWIMRSDGMSFHEQAAYFQNARLVVGAHGAGLTNIAFAPPKTAVLELRPLNRRGESPMWGVSYFKMCVACGFSYSAHVSENEHNAEDWSIDVSDVISTVRRLDARIQPAIF